jgi:DHA1 family multidrug resistance protein-like MFS transporter
MSVFRDTAAGFFIRYLSGNRLLKFPEDLPDFKLPSPIDDTPGRDSSTLSEKEVLRDESTETPLDVVPSSSRLGDVEQSTSRVIHPIKSKDGVILVDWYSTDDEANPHNWSSGKKTVVCGEIW